MVFPMFKYQRLRLPFLTRSHNLRELPERQTGRSSPKEWSTSRLAADFIQQQTDEKA